MRLRPVENKQPHTVVRIPACLGRDRIPFEVSDERS
jgi:hypothetical protein